jgi:hypothetical protein
LLDVICHEHLQNGFGVQQNDVVAIGLSENFFYDVVAHFSVHDVVALVNKKMGGRSGAIPHFTSPLSSVSQPNFDATPSSLILRQVVPPLHVVSG